MGTHGKLGLDDDEDFIHREVSSNTSMITVTLFIILALVLVMRYVDTHDPSANLPPDSTHNKAVSPR